VTYSDTPAGTVNAPELPASTVGVLPPLTVVGLVPPLRVVAPVAIELLPVPVKDRGVPVASWDVARTPTICVSAEFDDANSAAPMDVSVVRSNAFVE